MLLAEEKEFINQEVKRAHDEGDNIKVLELSITRLTMEIQAILRKGQKMLLVPEERDAENELKKATVQEDSAGIQMAKRRIARIKTEKKDIFFRDKAELESLNIQYNNLGAFINKLKEKKAAAEKYIVRMKLVKIGAALVVVAVIGGAMIVFAPQLLTAGLSVVAAVKSVNTAAIIAALTSDAAKIGYAVTGGAAAVVGFGYAAGMAAPKIVEAYDQISDTAFNCVARTVGRGF